MAGSSVAGWVGIYKGSHPGCRIMEDLPACAAGLESGPYKPLDELQHFARSCGTRPSAQLTALPSHGRWARWRIRRLRMVTSCPRCATSCATKRKSGCAWKAASGRHGQTTVLFAGHGAGEHGIASLRARVPYLNGYGPVRPPSTCDESRPTQLIQRAGGFLCSRSRPCGA